MTGMLSWQLTSLNDGEPPQKACHTRWINPLLRRLGCIQPRKILESTSEAPLPFCLSFRLTTESSSYIVSVPVFRSGKGQAEYVYKSMVF
jgi:hypothetical protein